jgi:hypothetical protein
MVMVGLDLVTSVIPAKAGIQLYMLDAQSWALTFVRVTRRER